MSRVFVTISKSVCYNEAFKKYLIGLQKGVSKPSKGHLLEAN